MNTIKRFGSIVATLTLLSTLALAAPKTERTAKYFSVAGTVIQIDDKDRTLLVTDRLSNRLYLVKVPEKVTFKITFGRYMRLSEAKFNDVTVGERVAIRCLRNSTEHPERVDNGAPVITLTAAR